VFTAILRDLAIIFLALESIVILAMMGILIWQIWRLTKMLQTEVKPIVRDAQDTINTVRGTTTFMGDNLVNPVVRANSKVAGFRRTAQVLMADLPLQPKQKPAPQATPVTPPPAPPEPPATI
jgi:hypothetical protein